MEVKAHLKNLRTSPRKVRLVADTVRGLPVTVALGKLNYDLRHAAPVVAKLVKSAVANAKHNENYTGDSLVISDIQVGAGPTLKRFRPRAYGRAAKILKRTSKITVILSDAVPVEKKVEKVSAPKKTAKKQEAVKVGKVADTPKESVSQSKLDDLTKVEGIGPKIAETLAAADIATFEALSETSSEKIQEIIAEVRGNHDSQTWPEQAKMAHEGRWDELEKWQDELDGGKA